MSEGKAPNRKTALVLQGGGARGAYQVGVIKAIATITGRRRSPFSIVCGASVGAINAASVAVTTTDFLRGAQHNEALWLSLTSASIYDTRALRLLLTSLKWGTTLVFGHFGMRVSGGLLDCTPLLHLLEREFDPEHLKEAIRSGALHALCITASSYAEGKAITFFEGSDDIAPWTRARRRGERASIGPAHIMASAALPFAFAPVQLGNAYFGDGSLRSTSPLSPAIHTGADRILIIATRDDAPDPPPVTRAATSPGVGEIAGHALDILFNDNLESDYERLTRINHTVFLLDDKARAKTPLRIVETMLLSPSQDLRKIAKTHAWQMPRAIRLLMRSIGSWGDDGRMESYLMFEKGYISALIDLGFADTMKRAGAIADFLKG